MVFSTLISAFNGNTSRYSQHARQYKPDWQRAYESAGVSENSSLNSLGRAGKAASDLLASSQPVIVTNPVTRETTTIPGSGLKTAENILAQASSKVLTTAKLYERIAIQTRIDRLGDPIKKLQQENPLYRDEPKEPIPRLKERARAFLRRLRQFQGIDDKNLNNPFPRTSLRVREDQVFSPDIVQLQKNYGLTQNLRLRASINSGNDFILEDVLRQTPSDETPTHVAVKLHGGKSDQAYTQQKTSRGVLQIYDAVNDVVVRTLDSDNTEILTFAEFQQLRYVSANEDIKNKLDYIDFIALTDGNSDGAFDDASDARGSHEQIAVAINTQGVNRNIEDEWQWNSHYLNEQKSRFSTAEVTLEGTFVGTDALTDYLNGDLEIEVTEAGYEKNRAVLDEAASSGNRLVFKFDYAYDGIRLVAKYTDNEVENTAISKAVVTLD